MTSVLDAEHQVADVAARLDELGLELPPVPAPVAAYVPAVRSGSWVWTSGQLPMVDGRWSSRSARTHWLGTRRGGCMAP